MGKLWRSSFKIHYHFTYNSCSVVRWANILSGSSVKAALEKSLEKWIIKKINDGSSHCFKCWNFSSHPRISVSYRFLRRISGENISSGKTVIGFEYISLEKKINYRHVVGQVKCNISSKFQKYQSICEQIYADIKLLAVRVCSEFAIVVFY